MNESSEGTSEPRRDPDRLPANLEALQEAAREVLPRNVYDYYAGGSEDESTLRANRAAWDGYRLRPRVLVDVSEIDTSVRLLGDLLPSPVALAPTAFQKLAHDGGEVAVARAAGRKGHLLVESSLATTPIEEVAEAAEGPVWLQLYVFRDRGLTEELVRRAEAAGCRAVCVTVDVPVQGNRERDAHNRFSLPDGVEMANFTGHIRSRFPDAVGGSALDAFIADAFDPSLTWEVVEWLRSVTTRPVVVKGIQSPEDGTRALRAGVDAVVVSNHGGRQLDGAEATARVLPEVVDAVAGEIPVLVDGGIRRGADVVRALALGADAVLIGRPYLWGLALGGEAGVAYVLDTLDAELERVLALLGCDSAASLDRSRLAPSLDRPRRPW